MASTTFSNRPCPCGSGSDFAACCAPVIADACAAKTAEQLMRSRYTAFAMGDARHLLASHRASAEQFSVVQVQELQSELGGQEWLALRILGAEKGRAQDETGIVEFVAYYRDTAGGTIRSPMTKSTVAQLHERSRFAREQGRWLYVDGDSLPSISIGRNDACWCGSGRKYKKCHIHTAEQ